MSKQQDFINQIAPYVVAWARQYGWGIPSAIIAQACLESAYGQSDKAQYHDYFGLKYKGKRVTCNTGKFTSASSEQRSDGTYYTITTDWYAFADMNTGVEGYYQFINSGNYSKAKQATNPRAYLQALKDAGYATSKNYVENNMRVVNTYNLTQYDGGIVMTPDSSLVSGVMWSPSYTAKRQYKIDTIIIHCMAGTYDAKRCGQLFADPSRKASSHYGISSNGEIWQYVPEKYRAWTTGGDKVCNGWTGSQYDHRSVTIEVSNTTLGNTNPAYQVSAEAMRSIINICTDICRRNGIPQLLWANNPKLVGDASKQNMALHRWFATKSCPGDFLVMCMANIALAVNQNLLAPTGYMLNGYDYSPVFDPEYYANRYPDLRAAFGNNAQALWLHFQNNGMNEFRQASIEFNPVAYKQHYPDVAAAFGNNNPMYYYHYVAFGKAEGRSGV